MIGSSGRVLKEWDWGTARGILRVLQLGTKPEEADPPPLSANRTRSTTSSSAFRPMSRCLGPNLESCVNHRLSVERNGGSTFTQLFTGTLQNPSWAGSPQKTTSRPMSFKETQNDSIFPTRCEVCLFSATMAPEILDMTSKFMRNAVRILVKKDPTNLPRTRRRRFRFAWCDK